MLFRSVRAGGVAWRPLLPSVAILPRHTNSTLPCPHSSAKMISRTATAAALSRGPPRDPRRVNSPTHPILLPTVLGPAEIIVLPSCLSARAPSDAWHLAPDSVHVLPSFKCRRSEAFQKTRILADPDCPILSATYQNVSNSVFRSCLPMLLSSAREPLSYLPSCG